MNHIWIPYHHSQAVTMYIKLTELVKNFCHSETPQNFTFILHISLLLTKFLCVCPFFPSEKNVQNVCN